MMSRAAQTHLAGRVFETPGVDCRILKDFEACRITFFSLKMT